MLLHILVYGEEQNTGLKFTLTNRHEVHVDVNVLGVLVMHRIMYNSDTGFVVREEGTDESGQQLVRLDAARFVDNYLYADLSSRKAETTAVHVLSKSAWEKMGCAFTWICEDCGLGPRFIPDVLKRNNLFRDLLNRRRQAQCPGWTSKEQWRPYP